MFTMKRNRVVWTHPGGGATIWSQKHALPRWLNEPTRPQWSTREGAVNPGDGFIVSSRMVIWRGAAGREAPPHPYAFVADQWNGCGLRDVPIGTIAVYLEEIHIADHRDDRSRPRQVFLIGGEKVIVYELACLSPMRCT